MKKKDMIKIIAGLFAAVTVMASFSSCSGNDSSSVSEHKESSVSDSEADEPETVRELTALPVGTEHDYENIRTLQTAGDNIYIFEQKNEVVQRELSVMVSVHDRTKSDFSLEAADYSYIQYMAINDNRTVMIYCDDDNRQRMCSIDAETGKAVSDVEISGDVNYSNIRSDGNGNFTVIKNDYTGDLAEIHLEWFDGDTLESVKDINLSGGILKSDSEAVIDAFACPDGSAYIFGINYTPDFRTEPSLYKLDSEGNLLWAKTDFDDWDEHFTGIYMGVNGNLCVATTLDYSEYYVRETDCETAELIEKHTINIPKFSNFISSLMLPGYDFTYISTAGVTGYNFKTGESETVLSFGEDLDPGLKDSFTASSCGDRIYFYSIANAESGRTVTAAGADGKTVYSRELDATYGYASAFCAAEDGTVVYAETYDPGGKKETSSGFNTAYIFHILDEKGNPKSSFKINEIDEYGDASIQKIAFGSDGNLYMLFQTFDNENIGTVVYVTDRSGKIIKKYDSTKQGFVITTLLVSSSGEKAVCIKGGEDGTTVVSFSPDGTLKEEFTVVLDDSDSILNGKGEHDLYWRSGDVIYGCGNGSDEADVIADLSGVLTGINDIYIDSESRFICSTYDSETGETGVSAVSVS